MKKLNLVWVVFAVFLLFGCGSGERSDAITGGGGEGIFGSVMSEQAPEKPAAVSVAPLKAETVKAKPVEVEAVKVEPAMPQPVEVEPVEAEPVKRLSGKELMVADFDSGMRPCNVGGDFGAWDRDPADFSQTCVDSFDTINKYGRVGFGIKLKYDVESPKPAYNGFWLKLANSDASGFRNLAFHVKGDEAAGYTNIFKVELKNASGEVGRYYVSGVTGNWTEISIPLAELNGMTGFDSLTEFVIVFEDRMATDKDGIIYIDNIRFTD